MTRRLDPLAALLHGFLQRDDVEGDGDGKGQGHGRARAPACGLPPGVEVAVVQEGRGVRGIGAVGAEVGGGGEVLREGGVDDLGHPAERRQLVVGDQAAGVGGEIEEHVAVAADGRVEVVHEALGALGALLGRPEPAVEDRRVHLGGVPPQVGAGGELGAAAEVGSLHVRPGEALGWLRQGDDAPFRGATDAAFVADPAGVGPLDRDDRIGPQAADQVVPRGVVVGLLHAGVGIRPVEPDDGDGAVLGQQLVELVEEVAVVVVDLVRVAAEGRGRLPPSSRIRLEALGGGRDDGAGLGAAVAVVTPGVRGVRPQLVQVGGREVDPQLETLGARGLGDGPDHVALSAQPGARDDGLGRVARGPHAEAVVVLAHEDHESAAGALHGTDPLLGVERTGVEYRRVLPAIAPLDAPERVRAEVHEEGSLEPHPCALVGARQRLRRLLGPHGGGVLRCDHVPGRVLDRRSLAATGARQPGHQPPEQDSSRDETRRGWGLRHRLHDSVDVAGHGSPPCRGNLTRRAEPIRESTVNERGLRIEGPILSPMPEQEGVGL